MKKILSIHLSVLLAAAVVCANQKPQWKGKIETENGIRVIKNPKGPLYGEIIFDLEEELSIGNENDENYIFYRGLDVAVDNKGNIFALDSGNLRIQKFDKNGRYLMTIGRRGQGPGEFQGLSGAFIDSKSNLYVNQSRSISLFDNNGKYIRSIPLGTYIYSFGITEEGNIIATTSTIIPTKSEDLFFFDSTGKRLKTLATFPNIRVVPAGGIALGAKNNWAFYLSFCPITEKIGVYAFSSEYKLYLIDSLRNIFSIIEKEEIPEMLTERDKENTINAEIEFLKSRGMLIPKNEIKKAYPFPPHKSFFLGGFMTDDLGDIYVPKFSTIKKELYYDLFNPKGYYLYKVIMKEAELPRIIKNGCIYAISMDKETGYFKVKRYRIKNWDQIKKEI